MVKVFARKNVKICAISFIGKMTGNKRGFYELGHRVASHPLIFSEINHSAFAETFHINKFAKFVDELFYFFGVSDSFRVATIEVNTGRESPIAVFVYFLSVKITVVHFFNLKIFLDNSIIFYKTTIF